MHAMPSSCTLKSLERFFSKVAWNVSVVIQSHYNMCPFDEVCHGFGVLKTLLIIGAI